jgi:hypothetical protein
MRSISVPSATSFVLRSERREASALAALSREVRWPDSGGRGAAASAPTYSLVVDGFDLSNAKVEEVAAE